MGVTGTSLDPGDFKAASYEGVGVGHLLDDLAGGLAGAVARLGVHVDEQGVGLLGPAAHHVLQGGNVLERMERDHAVVVGAWEQEDRGVLDALRLWDGDVVVGGVSEGWKGALQTLFFLKYEPTHLDYGYLLESDVCMYTSE